MEILYITQPVMFDDETMVFYVHMKCSCGSERSRYVSAPFHKALFLICRVCQEKCPIQFPIH